MCPFKDQETISEFHVQVKTLKLCNLQLFQHYLLPRLIQGFRYYSLCLPRKTPKF